MSKTEEISLQNIFLKKSSYMQKEGKEGKRTLNTIIKIKVNLFNHSYFLDRVRKSQQATNFIGGE